MPFLFSTTIGECTCNDNHGCVLSKKLTASIRHLNAIQSMHNESEQYVVR